MNIVVGCLAFVAVYVSNVILARPAYLLVALSAAALFMLMLGADGTQKNTRSETLVVNVSRYSYFIYLVYIPFVHVLYLLQERCLPIEQSWMNWILPLLIAIGTIAITVAVSWCVEKILGRYALYAGIAPKR